MKLKNKSCKTAICNWPEDERPRERLFKSGEHNLSNTELLAILLRTGVRGESAIDLARKIMQKFKSFRDMSHTNLKEWEEFKGIGKAKIAQLRAAIEIGRRLNNEQEKKSNISIENTEHVVELFKTRMRDLKYEVFKIILCDSQNRMIDVIEVAKGTPNNSFPIIRDIISHALEKYATGIICMHNHPRGNSEPSKEDELFTKELRKAFSLMDIKLLDHIIFGEEDYYSFDKMVSRRY
ncbi:MAG: hypothetical protein A2Y62_09885 [Candidatus Fischerbacteria bacterium RBG_13_37_8]|uniref:MPN domain-containing protein n=1 Tax=Candidatus Fischerbacteria bacterium RBG_13_37_8 TaxID=1817863 RepID=A0A1F5V5U7_9BACT|nr:MAG: hypothetical protein A2Y62_09885 [Candidatus Fischerbacteria bacterium RBG_13_37_8]